MALMEWNPRYEVGVSVLDEQHRGLFDLVNKLHEGLGAGPESEMMSQVFDELRDYVNMHFSDEENLMKKHGFEGLEAHCSEHEVFTSKMDRYRISFQGGDSEASEKVLEYLRRWLISHVTGTDREYISHFQAAGVE